MSVARQPLSAKVEEVLNNGRRDSDASADGWAVLLGMVQTRGWTYDDAFELAFMRPSAGLRHYRKVADERHNKFRGYRKLRRDWTKACRWAADHPAVLDRPSLQAELTEISSSVDDHRALFKGRAGTSDLQVMQALISIARKANRLTLSASVRDIADRANIRPGTAAAALNRLVEADQFIERVQVGRGKDASTYRLKCPPSNGGLYPDDVTVTRRSEIVLGDVHDLFASAFGGSQNLGPGPARTYAALTDTETTSMRDLVNLTGMHRSTVHRHVKTLIEVGLIERVGDRLRHTSATVAEVAESIVLVPVRAQRQALAERQRDNWTKYLARKEQERQRGQRWNRAQAHAKQFKLDLVKGEDGHREIDPSTGQIVSMYDREWRVQSRDVTYGHSVHAGSGETTTRWAA